MEKIKYKDTIENSILNMEKSNEDLGLFQIILKDEAIKKASHIDEKNAEGKKMGDLAGIPFIITDDISTKGIATTVGSKMLERYVPPFNASVIDRLLGEDAIILGKTRMNELGIIKDENMSKALDLDSSLFGLATSMVAGKVSMKTTYGLISRYGMISKTSSFDGIVPVTNCVEHMARLLNCIAGFDGKDSASINIEKIDYLDSLKEDIEGFKIIVADELFAEGSYPSLEKVIENLENLGVKIIRGNIDSLKYIGSVYEILSSAEFASNMAKFDGISIGYRTGEYQNIEELYKKSRSEAFGKEAKKKILFGNYMISKENYNKYYKNAQRIRGMIKEEIVNILDDECILLLPFTPDDSPYNLVAHVSGLPSISLAGGIQFVGLPLKESALLKLAYNYEKGQLENQGGAR